MNHLFRLKKFIQYQLRSKTKYYLHSPFVYQFYLNVLEGEPEPAWQNIEALRRKLLGDKTSIDVEDMGTGISSSRAISSIVANAAIQPKYGQLLYRLVKYGQPATIIELGTSLGLSSAYMALAKPDTPIISLEGSTTIATLAARNHASLNIGNIKIITGNFDYTLTGALQNAKQPVLIFFDGNHRKEATLRYFHQCLEYADENSIFIFDDIHWSKDMYSAWTEIQNHPRITLSIDIFQMGICFFVRGKMKESFELRY